jgi:DNA-binding transcriptional LysR family regulator
LSKHVQLVLIDRLSLTAGREFGVMSPQIRRLANGSLMKLRLKAHPLPGSAFPMHAIWLKDQLPGPAARWFVDRLKCDSV